MTLELHIKGVHPQMLKDLGDEALHLEIQRWRILAITGLVWAGLFAALFIVEVL